MSYSSRVEESSEHAPCMVGYVELHMELVTITEDEHVQ